MTREELQETVAATICCHTRMSRAVQWEIDLLMGAIEKHVALRLEDLTGDLCLADGMRQANLEAAGAAIERADRAESENERLREELRKAKRAADLLAADHRAVERVQRRLDAWEERLPETVRKDTVIDVLRHDLDEAA
ncbi:hypothetical protein ACWF8U_00610 [Streptomyces olivaceus]